MKVGKVILGAGAAVGMLASTVAMAATHAPTNGVRTAATAKHKSHQAEESATGTYIVGGLAAAAVIAGVVVVASDNSNNSSSNG